jgi:hypothetical protein
MVVRILRFGGRLESRRMPMGVNHKMHFVYPPVCGHNLYNLRLKHHYKSLASFKSCFIAHSYWSRSKETLKTMWLHQKMHFVHPLGCGHSLYTLRIRHHYRSLANFVSCLLAKFHWYISKSTLSTMWLYWKVQFVHPPGCGHTLYTLRVWTITNHLQTLSAVL